MEKILKFGGTSCGSVVSIQSVISIIESNCKAQTKFAVVFSAMSGVTNQLLEAGNLASKRKNIDNSIIEDIENRHFEIIKHFIPVTGQSQVSEFWGTFIDPIDLFGFAAKRSAR